MLLSAAIIPVLWLGYTFKAFWTARHDWPEFSAVTKAFYLLVAPPIALALDVLIVTDRLLYWPKAKTHQRPLGAD